MSIILSILFFLTSCMENPHEIIFKNIEIKPSVLNCTLLNNSTDTITFIGITVEVQKGSDWEYVRNDISCPCRRKCKKALIEMNPKEEKKFSWDYMDHQCKKAKPGTYRLVIHSGWDGKKKLYKAISEDIIIN